MTRLQGSTYPHGYRKGQDWSLGLQTGTIFAGNSGNHSVSCLLQFFQFFWYSRTWMVKNLKDERSMSVSSPGWKFSPTAPKKVDISWCFYLFLYTFMYDILMYTGTPTDRQIVRLAQILRPSRALRTSTESIWPPVTEGFVVCCFFLAKHVGKYWSKPNRV